MHFTNNDLPVLLNSIGMVAYRWNIQTDKMLWIGNGKKLFNLEKSALISTGSAYLSLFDEANTDTLHSHIYDMHTKTNANENTTNGVNYSLRYALCPAGHHSTQRVWVEDCGQYFVNSNAELQYANGIIHPITKQHKLEQHLQYMSRTDELTDQLNRWSLISELQDTIIQTQLNNSEAVFLIIAVDNLSILNESYGFDVSDQFLRNIAIHLSNKLRIGDIIGRYSGNKFGVILKGCTLTEAETVIRRFMSAVRNLSNNTYNNSVIISSTISVGAVSIPTQAKTANTVMIYAQEALNNAKYQQNENTYILYQASKKQESMRQRNISMTNLITSALNSGRITYAMQPIVSAKDEQPVMHECLVRIKQTDGTLLPAMAFLGYAEALNLVQMIDYRMLELVLSHLTQNPKAQLTVNISLDTTTDREWRDLLQTQAVNNPEMTKRLTIEITETRIISNPEEINQILGDLRNLGYKIAIDDFGAGYTSFRNLRSLNIDMVKIDGSFVKNLAYEPDNQVCVRALIDLAHYFNITSVAEWVETREDAELLKSWGIDYMQGHLFGVANTQQSIKQYTSYISDPYSTLEKPMIHEVNKLYSKQE